MCLMFSLMSRFVSSDAFSCHSLMPVLPHPLLVPHFDRDSALLLLLLLL